MWNTSKIQKWKKYSIDVELSAFIHQVPTALSASAHFGKMLRKCCVKSDSPSQGQLGTVFSCYRVGLVSNNWKMGLKTERIKLRKKWSLSRKQIHGPLHTVGQCWRWGDAELKQGRTDQCVDKNCGEMWM